MKRAVLLDALGTVVGLEKPWPHLIRALADRGVTAVDEADAERAMRAEMAYYRAHHDEARDAAGLRDLRERCAALVRAGLGLDLPLGDVGDALLEALRFHVFPEVPGVLRELRSRGFALAIVSNWDVSLHDVLTDTGLSGLVDTVVISAELGVAKPDPRIFETALARIGGILPVEAVHVGDSVEFDVVGAHAAGLDAILVVRNGAAPSGVRTIGGLDELLDDPD